MSDDKVGDDGTLYWARRNLRRLENAMQTRIGSEKAHTTWCRQQAKVILKRAKETLGPAWDILGAEVREAFVCSRIVGTIASQENEDLPVWRTQELIHETMLLLQASK